MARVITEIQKPNSEGQGEYDFGVIAENVFFSETEDGTVTTQATLKDFYNYVLNVFNNGFYTYWGTGEPTATNVRDWYYTEPYEL